jgi:hypothetical protein
VYRIVQRLRSELGALADPPHPLERPALILEEALHDVLAWQTVRGIRSPPSALAGLFALADERKLARAELALAIWRAWDDAGRPSDGAEFLLPDAAERGLFWPHIPGELLRALLADARALAPYDLFGEEQWQALLDALAEGRLPRVDPALLAHVSDALLEQLLASAEPTRELCSELWRRSPERALAEIARELDTRTDDAARLELWLASTPEPALPGLCALGDERAHLHDLPRPKLLVWRRFLHELVQARSPGYRAGYELLRRIDTQSARSRVSAS